MEYWGERKRNTSAAASEGRTNLGVAGEGMRTKMVALYRKEM